MPVNSDFAQDEVVFAARGGLSTRAARLTERHIRELAAGGGTCLHTHAGCTLTGTPGGQLGGTWACPTVDASHSGSAHHTRSHTMLGTSDHTSGNWKTFHSNACGQLVELTNGANATFLRGAGTCAAPTYSAILCGDVPATHAGSAHHTKYLDSEALAAAEAETTFAHGGSVTSPLFYQFTEQTAPCAGGANTARLFAVVNGCSKTELRVIFQSGASQVIATEP